MDDNGHEQPIEESDEWRLTPQGWFMTPLVAFGATIDQAEEQWVEFEGYAMKSIARDYPDASHAALVFDGEGGQIIGLTPGAVENE